MTETGGAMPEAPPMPSPAPAPTPTAAHPFQEGQILYAIPGHIPLGNPTTCTVRIAPS
ncbi:MAG: hypothetical protein R2795_11355 [Saprospiraceae bacterium]